MPTPEDEPYKTKRFVTIDEVTEVKRDIDWQPRMHEGDTLHIQIAQGVFDKFVVKDGKYVKAEEEDAE